MNRPSTAAAPPQYDGLAPLAGRYDAYILDLWGVLHDGVRAYPGAVDCLQRLKAAGKRRLVLSNAPRPSESIARRIRAMGLGDHLYDALVSSGDEVRRHLRERPCPWYRALGRRLYHLGPERDRVVLAGIDFDEAAAVEAADVVLCTGPPRDGQGLGELMPLLERAAARGLPMICANPDLTVLRGAAVEFCAGSLAARYQALGGEVRYHGKPHRPIYETCFRLLGGPERARSAAVGDSLRTDVAGARGVGIDAVFVTGGLHADELGAAPGEAVDPGRLAAFCAAEGCAPTAAIPAFRW